MARFIKVENIVVNVDLICAVTERVVVERITTEVFLNGVCRHELDA